LLNPTIDVYHFVGIAAAIYQISYAANNGNATMDEPGSFSDWQERTGFTTKLPILNLQQEVRWQNKKVKNGLKLSAKGLLNAL